jgi:hypothetical protein
MKVTVVTEIKGMIQVTIETHCLKRNLAKTIAEIMNELSTVDIDEED